MSPETIRNVLVIGASGLTGRPTVKALSDVGFVVSALTRDASKAQHQEGVKIIESDYSPDSLVKAFQGQDAIVSTIATPSVTEQIKTIDAAITAGVKRFIPSEFGVDTADPQVLDKMPPLKPKFETVEYLKAREDKISWTALITGGYFESYTNTGLTGLDIKQKQTILYDDGDFEFETTNLSRIVEALVAILSPAHYVETSNKHVYINSFTLTQNKLLSALEKATGGKFEFTERRSRAEDAANAWQGIITGTPGTPSFMENRLLFTRVNVYNAAGLNNFSKTRELWNDRLGLKKESLEETVKKAVDATA